MSGKVINIDRLARVKRTKRYWIPMIDYDMAKYDLGNEDIQMGYTVYPKPSRTYKGDYATSYLDKDEHFLDPE